jgi:hypothetical protein
MRDRHAGEDGLRRALARKLEGRGRRGAITLYIPKVAEYRLSIGNKEDGMSFMKSLTLTAAPKVNHDPVRNRRDRLIARLQEQKELIANPALVRTVQRTVKKDGVRTVVEVQQKVRPWWRTDEKGQVVLLVRIGWHFLEFEKGKTGIAAGSMERLPVVIDTLIEAVRAGELDPVLSQSRAIPAAAKRRAA